jgi:hypothetical protein
MRGLITLCTVVASLVLAGGAAAGGWATVGFEPLPAGTNAGSTWHPTITVKQHGVTPLEGLAPVVTIEEQSSGEQQSFVAVPTSSPGVYNADVVFPAAGDWRVAVESGFGDSRVTYGPVTIGDAGSRWPGIGEAPLGALAAALVLGLALVAAAVLGARRARRPMPAGR